MNYSAKNIAVGLGILGLVALGSWNLALQRRGNYYHAAFQSEKKDSSKIFKENEKEILDLREKLREVDKLREKADELREKFEKDVNALERKLDSRNKQIFDYKNKIKSFDENIQQIAMDFNERYNLLENKFNASEEDNNLLSSNLQASKENYRDIYQTFEWMLEELARIDSDIMDREILDSKENPYYLIKEELEKAIKRYGKDESIDIIKKKQAIIYFSQNIRNLNLFFTNIAEDTLFDYDKHHKIFHPSSVYSLESENDLEDLVKTGAHVFGVRVNNLSETGNSRIFNIFTNDNRNYSLLIDLVMQGEKGRDVHPDARLRFFRWGNNNAVQKTENLVNFYEKSLGKDKERLRGVIHLNKSPIFYVFSKHIFKAFRDSVERKDRKQVCYVLQNGIFSRDFWMENHHDVSVDAKNLEMDFIDVDHFIDWDDNQDEINKKLINAIERSKSQSTNLAVDISNKKAIRQITYFFRKSS
jgi:archaellum component FlaC